MDATRRFERILLADDGSKAGASARALAVELARTTDAKLSIVYVLEPYQDVADGEAALSAARALAEREGVPYEVRVEPPVGVSNPGRRLVQAAQDTAADVIVLGARGLGGVSRILLGSVSTFVAHHAPCAVLIAR